MQIPGYPNYEWNGTEVLNIESGNVLKGNDRRRVNLRNEEGGKSHSHLRRNRHALSDEASKRY